MKLGIIGCGKIGSGIAKRLAAVHELLLVDRHQKSELQGKWVKSAKEAAEEAEVLVIAVKPQDLEDLSAEIGKSVSNKVVISVLAGIDTHRLQAHFSEAKIVRIMPNIAIDYGKGSIGIVDDGTYREEEKKEIEELLSPLGHLHWFSEAMIDSFTALCGSGPAFIFVLIEAMVEAGILLGIEPKLGLQLTHEMIEGALATLKKSKKLPQQLKWEVASPGGMTIVGLKTMEDEGIRAGIINTLLNTYERSKDF